MITKKSLFNFSSYFFLFLFIICSPFYFFASGMPQPTYILIFISSILIIFCKHKEAIPFILNNQFVILFFSLVFLLNSFYFLYYKHFSFLINTSYWLYNLVILLASLIIAENTKFNLYIRRLIFIKLIIIFLCYILGFGGYEFWPRYDYFFNGPNQLGYFLISLLLIYFSVSQRKINISFAFILFLVSFGIFSTGSRSVFLALLSIVLIFLWQNRHHLKKIILIILPLFFCILISMQIKPIDDPNGKYNNYEKPKAEIIKNSSYIVNFSNRFIELTDFDLINDQLQARGYYKLLDYPSVLFLGAGQGFHERFSAVRGHYYEIHSSFASILFYYGIFGFIFFIIFIVKLFDQRSNIIYLMPFIVYGLFTYGLRSPYFWLALAFIIVINRPLGVIGKFKK